MWYCVIVAPAFPRLLSRCPIEFGIEALKARLPTGQRRRSQVVSWMGLVTAGARRGGGVRGGFGPLAL